MALLQHRMFQVDDPDAEEGVDRVAFVTWNGLVFVPYEDGMIKGMAYADWRQLASVADVPAGDPPFGELMDRYVYDGVFRGVMIGDRDGVHVVRPDEARERVEYGPTTALEMDRGDVEAILAADESTDEPDDENDGDDEHPVSW